MSKKIEKKFATGCNLSPISASIEREKNKKLSK